MQNKQRSKVKTNRTKHINRFEQHLLTIALVILKDKINVEIYFTTSLNQTNPYYETWYFIYWSLIYIANIKPKNPIVLFCSLHLLHFTPITI